MRSIIKKSTPVGRSLTIEKQHADPAITSDEFNLADILTAEKYIPVDGGGRHVGLYARNCRNPYLDNLCLFILVQ